MNKFIIDRQSLRAQSMDKIVGGSINYLCAEFVFDNSWDGYTKVAHFNCGACYITITLNEDDKITDEDGLNLTDGLWSMYVVGEKTGSRITTCQIAWPVLASGRDVGTVMPQVTHTTQETILNDIEDLKDRVEDIETNGTVGGGTGTQGPTGATGPAGADGKDGADGKSAYELAQDSGYTGTQEEWLASLKGDTGDTGPTGATGEQGISVTGASINSSNHLILTLSNGTTIDAGAIPTAGETSTPSMTLTYTFTNQTAGNGDGSITLLANTDDAVGDYSVCWADADGVLSGYKPINTMTLTTVKDTDVTYDHLISVNMIPIRATKIVAIQNDEIKASFSIPSGKQISDTDLGTKLSTVCLISDSHVSSSVDTSSTDLQDAFQTFASSVSAFIHAGDVTDGGTASHWGLFQTAKTNYAGTTPVYAAAGNHDNYTNAIDITTALTTYTDSDGIYFAKTIDSQLWLFVGLVSCDNGSLFSADEKTWLETQLEAHRSERVFVVMHTPILNTVGNPGNAYNNLLLKNNDEATKITALMSHYTNAIMITGHTHFSADEQETSDSCNYYCNSTCKMIHVPSLSKPKDVESGSEVSMSAEAECVVMDIYENSIILKYYDVANDKYFGAAQYMIDTTPVTIAANPDLIAATLSSISVTKTTTTYTQNATLSTNDITVTATYSDDTTRTVTGWTSDASDVDMTTTGSKTLTVTYAEGGVTKTDTVSITVTEAAADPATLSSISATKTTVSYSAGSTLSTDDITVTALYSDNTASTVTGWTTNANSVDMTTAGTKTLTVSYAESGITKTYDISITVNAESTSNTVYYSADHNLTFSAKGVTAETVNKVTMDAPIPSGTHLYAKWDSVNYSGSDIETDAVGVKTFKLYQDTTAVFTYAGESYQDYSTEVDLGTTEAAANKIYYILASSSSSNGTFPVTMVITGFKIYSKS